MGHPDYDSIAKQLVTVRLVSCKSSSVVQTECHYFDITPREWETSNALFISRGGCRPKPNLLTRFALYLTKPFRLVYNSNKARNK